MAITDRVLVLGWAGFFLGLLVSFSLFRKKGAAILCRPIISGDRLLGNNVTVHNAGPDSTYLEIPPNTSLWPNLEATTMPNDTNVVPTYYEIPPNTSLWPNLEVAISPNDTQVADLTKIGDQAVELIPLTDG